MLKTSEHEKYRYKNKRKYKSPVFEECSEVRSADPQLYFTIKF